MVEVPMGVDYEVDAVSTDLTNGFIDLGNHLWKLIVDDEHAVTTDRNRYIPADAE